MSSSELNLENYLIPLEEVIRATENFSRDRCIGGGGFGAVYKGQLSERWENRITAIKRLSRDSNQGKHEFYNELEMISRFNHKNIISFIGYCDEENEMIIVYEYAINGSLDHHLEDPNRIRCITWIQRLMICIGVAKGLNYLHSGLGEQNRVIHRDVKSANILLDGNFVAKLCDFGLSKLGPRNQPDTELYTKVAGTQFYVDPTYHESRILRKESDVYSFGVVLFEILSGMLVYRERSIGDEQQFLMNSVRRYHHKEPEKVIDPHIRDQIDRRSFDTFRKIAYQCISFNLTERPMLDAVIMKIEEALTIQMSESFTSTPAERSKIDILLRKLNSMSPDDQRMAAGEIRLHTKINTDNRVAFAKAGAIPLVTNLLTAADSRTQENAVTALLNLSICEDNIGCIVSSKAVPGIIHVLREGSMEARENAAATLFCLCFIEENKLIIGGAGAIPPLVSLLSEGTQRGKKDAVTALFSLCLYQVNKGRAVRAGVVPMLVELLTELDGLAIKDEVLGILTILSSHPEGKLAVGNVGALAVLVEIIGTGSPNNKENAAAVLVELSGDENYLLDAQKLGVMDKLMGLLHHGTDRGKKKAALLLKKMSSLKQLQNLFAQMQDPMPTEAHTFSIPAEGFKLDLLLGNLNSGNQQTADNEIRLLASRNHDNYVAIIAQAGAIPLLTHLLNATDSQTQELAVTALLNLSIPQGNKRSIVSSGAVPGIIHVLREGSMAARENAAAILFSLSAIGENQVAIGAAGAIPLLVSQLSEGTQRGKKDAACALFNLCLFQDNKGRLVRAGVVPMLMQLLTEEAEAQGGTGMMDEALAILAILSTHTEGMLVIRKAEAAVPILVDVIGSGSPRNKENAAAVLVNLCSGEHKYLVEARELGVRGKLIDLLIHGTDRGKRKAARLLAKIEESPLPPPPPPPPPPNT